MYFPFYLNSYPSLNFHAIYIVKPEFTSVLRKREFQWLLLSSSPIDNHNVTSSGKTSAAPCAGQRIPAPYLPTELRSTWKKQGSNGVLQVGKLWKLHEQTQRPQKESKSATASHREHALQLAFKLLWRIVIWGTQHVNVRVKVSEDCSEQNWQTAQPKLCVET